LGRNSSSNTQYLVLVLALALGGSQQAAVVAVLMAVAVPWRVGW
jgi:hypothetical protein